MTGRWLRPVVGMLIAVLVGVVAYANAEAFHGYSAGYDTSSRTGNNYYSGVSVQRNDVNMALSTNSDCTTSYDAPVANQSQWVAMDPTGATWLELGTADKTCSGGRSVKYWFAWMSNPNGFSNFIWRQQITGGAVHRFFLTNGTDGYWRWYVDQTLEAQYYWPNLGFYDSAGTESWDLSGKIPYSTINGMVKQINWAPWTGWSGSGPWVFDPPLAGNYLDINDAFTSEN